MASPEIIAHGIPSLREAKFSIESGVAIAELDVSQSLLGKFFIQHNGLLGKLGVGESLAEFLNERTEGLLFDIKHPRLSFNFARGFSQVLISAGIKEAKVCGPDWNTVSQVCERTGFSPYYSLNTPKHVMEFPKKQPELVPAEGLSVHHRLITDRFMSELESGMKVLAWDVNNRQTASRMHDLGVSAVISSNPLSIL